MKVIIIMLVTIISLWGYTRVDGCVTGWSAEPSEEQLNMLTHVLIFSIAPASDGSLIESYFPSWINGFSEKCHTLGTKLMVGVGGWGLSDGFSSAVLPENRGNFVSNLKQFYDRYNLDGFNLDWEFPTDEQFPDYIEMLSMLKDSIPECELGFAASAGRNPADFSDNFYNIVDFVELMTYDFYPSTMGHANMETFLQVSKRWGEYADSLDARGVSFSKKCIALGLPFYARAIADPEDAVLYRDLISGGGSSSSDIWEKDGKRYGYNGTETIREKTRFAVDSAYGGVMIWAVSQDLDCSDERSLLRAIDDEVRNGGVPVLKSSSQQLLKPFIRAETSELIFSSDKGISQIMISTVQGKLVRSLSGRSLERISTEGLSKGVYVISAKIQKQVLNQKVILF